MLLEFRVKNFKAFKDEAVFSMVPTKIKDLDNSVLKKKIDDKEFKSLPSSVIYGANATGKTNIIEAMEDFREIIIEKNILNKEKIHSPNISHSNLELIPNVHSSENDPTIFSILFISDEKIFKYLMSINLGGFANKDYKRKILSEQFFVNDKELFERKENKITLNFKNLNQFIEKEFNEKESEDTLGRLENNLLSTDLFLTSGFKNIYSSDLVKTFEDWLTSKFVIICCSEKFIYSPKSQEIDEKTLLKYPILDKALKQLGTISEIGYHYDNKEKEFELASVIKTNEQEIAMSSTVFESLGTLRIANLLPLIFIAIEEGCTLVIDEFDASIHPMIIMNIIKIFHDEEINKNCAQLIFNTHNPIFLNNSLFIEPLFRRDEIKFVDKDDDKKTSIIYSLSDFGTNTDTPVRNTTDYMKNYFISKYGATRDIDLSDIFIDEENNVQ